MTESVAPSQAGITPYNPLAGAMGVATGTDISITFSEAMDPFTVTTNTGNDTSCSGSFQVSKNSIFSSCVKMSNSSPSASNGNKTFTVDPDGKLADYTWYYVRITIQVKDTSGNNLNSQIQISFTTD